MVAGEDKLLSKRKKVDKIVPNNIAVTPAIGLKAKYTIHTVGLAWQGGSKLSTMGTITKETAILQAIS